MFAESHLEFVSVATDACLKIRLSYHGANIQKGSISSLIFRHTLDASLFDVELPREPLELRVSAVAVLEALAMYRTAVSGVGVGVQPGSTFLDVMALVGHGRVWNRSCP
jgi:hypothetical protein